MLISLYRYIFLYIETVFYLKFTDVILSTFFFM